MNVIPRWLTAAAAADYIGCRDAQFRRFVAAGKVPAPSYHLGQRSPRYDRFALDAVFTDSASSASIDELREAAVDAIRQRARRSPAARNRRGQGIPVPQKPEGAPAVR